MAAGDIVHKKFSDQKADTDEATFTSDTEWKLADGTPMLTEERTMTFHQAAAPARLMIDFSSKLTPPSGDVKLEGDPEHGGVQFRPSGDIDTKATDLRLPRRERRQPHKDLDYPWVGETFTLAGQKHSVVEMSHPENPKGTKWSAYRDYGRFGAYPTASVKKGESLTVKYRFLIADGEMPPAEAIQKSWDQFAGAKEPTPTPKVTVLHAEGGGPSGKPATKPVTKPAKKEPAAK